MTVLTRAAVLERIGAEPPYATSRPICVREVRLANPGPTEILVRIEAAGLCHSDLSVVNADRPRPTPMALGHEAAGIVEALGDEVTGMQIGQRVVMTFLPRCGDCAQCRTDGRLPCGPGTAANTAGTLLSGARRLADADGPIHHHLGVSGFAERAVVDARSVVPVDADIPPHIAALLGCATLTGGGAVLNVGKPDPGDTTAIVGLGGVGMAALLVAIAQDKGPVIGIDANPAKFDVALRAGAAECLTPAEAVARELRAEVVVECAGHPRAFETAFAVTAPGGRTVTVGLPRQDARSEIAPLLLTAEARTVIGSYLGSAIPANDIPVYARMWREHRLPLELLVSSTIELEQISEAMDELSRGAALRQIIRFD